MANQRNVNPFEQDGPTPYEHWLYVMGQAHGSLIVELSQSVELVKQMIKEHMEHHVAANKAVLDMPEVKQSEKPS